MKSARFWWRAGLLVLVMPGTVQAEEKALLDLLVRKGVLTSAEARAVGQELREQATASPANRIQLSESTSELKLYGDLRLRYQYDTKDLQANPPGVGVSHPEEDRSPTGTQRSRMRYRLRLDADFKLGAHWFGGVELQTNEASDSANQTFENGFNDYPIFLSRAYVGWKNEWLTLTGGKVPNPFYSTDLVWDPDITPTGLTQSIHLSELFGTAPEAGDGKKVLTASPWNVTLNLGEFIFDDNPESEFDNDASTDPWLFQAQLVASYRFAAGPRLTLAPAWMVYTAGDVSGAINENPFTDVPGVSGETRNLSLLVFPGDVTFKALGMPMRFYWDLAYNIDGRKRTENTYMMAMRDAAGRLHSKYLPEDNWAWLLGVQLGENKKSGDWSLLLNWRQTGIGSVDPNLNDNDFAAGELNTRGIQTRFSYNITPFAVGSLTYAHAWNLRDNLTGGQATTGAAIADENSFDILQVDVTVKF